MSTDIAALMREAANGNPQIDISLRERLEAAAASLESAEPVAWLNPSTNDVLLAAQKAARLNAGEYSALTASRFSEPLYLAPQPAVPDALTIEGAIGGAYQMLDGREFWIDAAVAQEITRRVLAATGDSHHE